MTDTCFGTAWAVIKDYQLKGEMAKTEGSTCQNVMHLQV